MQNSGSQQLDSPSKIIASTKPPLSSTSPQTSEVSGIGNKEVFEQKLPEIKTIQEYEAINKKTFIYDALGINGDLKLDSLENFTKNIDSFIKNEIERLNLDGSLKSYKDILSSLISQAMINENEKSISKAERLYSWIEKIILPQRKLDEARRMILYGKS